MSNKALLTVVLSTGIGLCSGCASGPVVSSTAEAGVGRSDKAWADRFDAENLPERAKHAGPPPKYRKLEGERLYHMLVGQSLSIDFAIPQDMTQRQEWFYPSGEWRAAIATSGNTSLQGRWFVRSDAVCIDQNNNIICRKFWISPDRRYIVLVSVDRIDGSIPSGSFIFAPFDGWK